MAEKFEREQRYIIIKIKDIENFDSDPEKKCPISGPDFNERIKKKIYRYLDEIEGLLSLSSRAEKTSNRKCVVVESDWPEYEHVWGIIKSRVTGEDA